ncbi:MAG: hypothetical protein HYZ81_11450, partial [Nitrospinae bacterium]|nr:hypothetical protein [Nitrospinota bacterium]
DRKSVVEERPPGEVTHMGGRQIVPTGVGILNPAFDVTPHCYVHALITEVGVLRPPFGESIALALGHLLQPVPG